METKIRLLKKGDIPACVKIILETKAGSNKREVEKLLILSLKKSISFLNPNYYILELNQSIIGVSGLYYDYEDPKDILWMDYLAISKKFQRQGFGTILLNNLIAICKKKAVRMLCVFAETNQAISFYKNNGFAVVGKIENYYGKGKPRVWLSKKV